MSETTTETESPDPAVAEAPETVVETSPTEQTAASGAPTETVQDPAPKVSREDRRFANLTARNVALANDLASKDAELQAARALLEAKKPEEDAPANGETVEQAATRLIADRDFAARKDAVVAAGYKEFGKEEWDQHTDTLHSLGATNNTNFIAALIELPNAPQLVAALAEDTDALVSILKKPPVSMAAEMGRMAAKIEAQATEKPKAPLSAAPTPVVPVKTPTVVREVDPYQIKTAADWKAYREKTAPRRLGGKG